MVLAAGLGTRLLPLTEQVPKPLVPLGLETALARWLRWMGGQGIADVVVNLHHLGAAIRREIEERPVPGVRVRWSEEPEILGTGGGVRRAIGRLGPGPFLVVNADAVLVPNLPALVASHQRSGAKATMLVRRDPLAGRFGAVEADASGIVRRLLGAPAGALGPLDTFMFTGVQILDPSVEPLLPERGCIVRTLHRALVDAGGGGLGAFEHEGPWFDVGSIAGYLAANLWISGEAVLAHPSARVDAAARVGPSVVLGAGAHVRSGTVRRAVVWPGTVVEADLEDSVATPFATLTSRASAPRSR